MISTAPVAVRMYQGTGRQPLIAHESMEFESHLALVRVGLGIALVPRLGREDLTDDLVALKTHDPVPTRDIVVDHRLTVGQIVNRMVAIGPEEL
jgi:DNA-binding transcriptional LysR family regulator